jgi:hypothetical protein
MPVTARRVYSAQELHRLRDSSSQPKLREAIEQHDVGDAEVVKGMSEPRARGTRPHALIPRRNVLTTIHQSMFFADPNPLQHVPFAPATLATAT